MPRKAREKKLFSIYLIKQCGPKSHTIFKSQNDRKLFINTLKKTKLKYNFKLYGVSIGPNNYEILLYDNGNDISKIMKSLNISFVMQYQCSRESCSNIFKSRYKSEIVNSYEVQTILNEMDLCLYLDKNIIDLPDISNDSSRLCIDCYKKAEDKLKELIILEDISFEEMLKKKELRNQLIQGFRKNTTLSLIEIGKLFDGLSESAICKILNK